MVRILIKNKIYEILENKGEPLGSKEIANAGDLNYNSVRRCLTELVKENKVAKVKEVGRRRVRYRVK